MIHVGDLIKLSKGSIVFNIKESNKKHLIRQLNTDEIIFVISDVSSIKDQYNCQRIPGKLYLCFDGSSNLAIIRGIHLRFRGEKYEDTKSEGNH